jgi:hypothetical protein
MKDTPRTDEWETYCDEWYYHLWRLRRKNEREFNDGFHINNGDEAKGLCDLLNNLEAKLTAVTEQRDRLAEALERILDYQGRFAEEEPESIAKEALKSLITNK